MLLTSSSVPFSNFYGQFRNPQHAAERASGTVRRRVRTEANRPRERHEAARLRTKSEAVPSRTNRATTRRRKPSEAVQLQTNPEFQLREQFTAPPPSGSFFPGGTDPER